MTAQTWSSDLNQLSRSARHQLRIGVDTGGTFTDFVAIAGARLLSFKLPSTPHNPAQAILEGIEKIIKELTGQSGQATPAIEIVHGTTIATNALLERKGARTALITTAGFEDVIEIGRQARPDLYNFAAARPAPLIPHPLRFGITERMAADGTVLVTLNPGQLNQLIAKLKRFRVESVAISLLFSFANPQHERAVEDACRQLGVPLSASHRLLPEYREYERTSTVVINAYLAPRVSRYLTELISGLQEMADDGWQMADSNVDNIFEADRKSFFAFNSAIRNPPSAIRIMQSSGGSISAEVAAREPVRTILSGPAGGIVAATSIAALAAEPDILTFDMGGTSTDVALCQGEAQVTNEAQITGLPVAIPVLDIHTVGAGGGSIAFVDAGGALRVGPASAGADPGPACYGRGTRATVTDANLALGRFGGAGLLGGSFKLNESRAAQALDQLAEEMSRASARKVTRHDAALGIIRIVNANMEAALRLVSIQRGHDPRRFALLSFGGAGGLHAVALAEALRIPKVIVPATPGAFSALGVLLADVIRDYSRTVMLRVNQGDQFKTNIEAQFAELEAEALRELHAEGFADRKIRLSRSLAMRYAGQSFELNVPCPGRLKNFANVLSAFHRLHQERYGHSDAARAIEIVSVRLRGTGLTSKPPLRQLHGFRAYQAKPQAEAAVRLKIKPERLPIFDREHLKPGAQLTGPALLIEYGSTTLIPPGWKAVVDGWRNLRIGIR